MNKKKKKKNELINSKVNKLKRKKLNFLRKKKIVAGCIKPEVNKKS